MKKLIAVGVLSGAMMVAGVTMTQKAASAYSTTNCSQDGNGIHCTTYEPPAQYPFGQAPFYNPPIVHHTDCSQDGNGIHCTTY